MKEGDSVWLTGLSKAAALNGSSGTVIGRRGERFLVSLDDQKDQVSVDINICISVKTYCEAQQEIAVKEENMILRHASTAYTDKATALNGAASQGFGLSSLEKQRALHFSLGLHFSYPDPDNQCFICALFTICFSLAQITIVDCLESHAAGLVKMHPHCNRHARSARPQATSPPCSRSAPAPHGPQLPTAAPTWPSPSRRPRPSCSTA